MKKENIERDYRETLDTKFIERVGSPFKWEMPILGTGRKVKPIKNKKILVIRLKSCAELYALNNSVTYVTDSKEKYDKFLEKVNDEKFGSDDTAVLIDCKEWKDIDKLMKDKKFDICIMNPPYDGSLHLKILEKVLNFCDKVVNISPIQWLQDPLAKYKKNSDYYKFESSVSKHIVDLKIYNLRDTNTWFDISNFGDLGIYVLEGNGGYDYTLPSKLRIGKSYSILERVLEYKDHIADHLEKGIDGFSVKVAAIRGFGSGKNFDIVSKIHSRPYSSLEEYKACKFSKKDVKSDKSDKDELFLHVKTLEEGINFVNSTRTKFFHFLIKCWKLNQHVPLNFLPYMQDYTQPWTNKRFCEFFNITGYADDNTAEPGSEWEIILNTVK